MASYQKWVYYSLTYLLLAKCTFGALRPRGVPLSTKIFYDPSQQFRCLDGSGVFPFHYVNDDFCDCEDGSDEPGTSACLNGIFNCLNHGHIPLSLPSSRVNDGICDCCDSSDEYNSPADCFNNCKELGQAAFSEAKKAHDIFVKGQEIRSEYIKLGKEKMQEYKLLLDELLKQEADAIKVKNEKQDEKENAETKEDTILSKEREFRKAQQKRIAAEKRLLLEHQRQEEAEGLKAFAELDNNKDGKLTVSEIKSSIRFDYDGDGKVSDSEAQFYMHRKEEMKLEDFLATGWKIMKPAFTINEVSEESVSSTEDSLSEVADFKEVDKNPQSESSITNSTEKDDILKDAAMARKDFADADKLVRDIQAEIWHLKRKLKADFGEDDEFLVLENECFDFPDKRYLYKFCPFDKVTQLVRVNQEETLIGLWDKWNGPGEDHYQQMKYSRGATCWNGPNRSVTVVLHCGTENKVTSVVESSPCTYIFEFTTPALCKNLPHHINEILKNDVTFI